MARFDDPGYVSAIVTKHLLAYRDRSWYIGKRILDFGCGIGASTLAIAEAHTGAEVIGVELSRVQVETAKRIARERGIDASFQAPPSGDGLPDGLGEVDVIMMSAVWEHLLPHERRSLLPLLFSHLKPGGLIFMNQTPHSWFPYEHHSTLLWGINYLPDRLAHLYARKCSRLKTRVAASVDWTVQLRGGIRGGSEREILRLICQNGIGARVANPLCGSRAKLWASWLSPRYKVMKKAAYGVMAASERAFGVVPAMNMELVLEKTTGPLLVAMEDRTRPAHLDQQYNSAPHANVPNLQTRTERVAFYATIPPVEI